MKKTLIIIELIFVAFFAFQFTANAEEVDTEIHLDIQTILEKEYENKGITGLYDIDMFQDADSPFKVYKNNKDEYYNNIKNVLFVKENSVTNEADMMTGLQENGLFTKVNYHLEDQKADSKSSKESNVLGALIFFSFVAVGIIASFIYIHFKKKKEVTDVYNYNIDNKQIHN